MWMQCYGIGTPDLMVLNRVSGQIESDVPDIRNACKSLRKNLDYRLGDCALLVFTDSRSNMHTQNPQVGTLWLCVCEISRPCDSNGCVSWAFRFLTARCRAALSLSAVIMGDGKRSEGYKFGMRARDEAFCRPPIGVRNPARPLMAVFIAAPLPPPLW